VITYLDEPGAPRYEATIHKWVLEPELPDALFEFTAPEGAIPVAPSDIIRR